MKKKISKDKVCKAPNDSNGTPCKGKVIAKGLCSRHYQQVYQHGKIMNNPIGPKKTEERLRVEAEVRKYRGKDAYYDISNKLEAEGFDRIKIRKILWHVLRAPKKKSGSR